MLSGNHSLAVSLAFGLASMNQHIWVAFQRLVNGRNVPYVSSDKLDVAQDRSLPNIFAFSP